MADETTPRTAPTPSVRRRMQRTPQRDTPPELRVRRAAYARGLRYRVHAVTIPGIRSRADMVFRGARVAVYIDGCFWHGCPTHGTKPKKNAAYWGPKLEANRARDGRVVECLEEAGWTALRFFECEGVVEVVDEIERVVRSRSRRPQGPVDPLIDPGAPALCGSTKR